MGKDLTLAMLATKRDNLRWSFTVGHPETSCPGSGCNNY